MLLWYFSLEEEDIENKNKSISATASVDQQSNKDAIEWLPNSNKSTVPKELSLNMKTFSYILILTT